jgi:hypothetical protein
MRLSPATNPALEEENPADNLILFLINDSGPGINKLSLPTHENKTVFYFSVSNGHFEG